MSKNSFKTWLASHQGPGALIFALSLFSAVTLVSLLVFSPGNETNDEDDTIEVPTARERAPLAPDSVFSGGWIDESNNPAYSVILGDGKEIIFTPNFWADNIESKTVRDEWLNVAVGTNNAIKENKFRAAGTLLSVYNNAYSLREIITDVNTVVMSDLNLNYDVEIICNFEGQTISLDGANSSYVTDAFTPLVNDDLTYFVDWDRDENYTSNIFFIGWAVVKESGNVKGLMTVAYNDEWQELIFGYAEIDNLIVERVIKSVIPGSDPDGFFSDPEMLISPNDSLRSIVEFMILNSVSKMDAGDDFHANIFYDDGSIWDVNNGFKYSATKTYTDYSYDLTEEYFYGLTYEILTSLDDFRYLFNEDNKTFVYNLNDGLIYNIVSNDDGTQHELYDVNGNPTSYMCTTVDFE